MNEVSHKPESCDYKLEILAEPESRYLRPLYQRQEKILMWLALFGHSNYEMLCHVAGYSTKKDNNKAMRTHLNAGIIEKQKVGRTKTSPSIYTLTPVGWRQASDLQEFTNPAKRSPSSKVYLWHDLNVQHDLLSRPLSLAISQIDSARSFRFKHRANLPGETIAKIPDYIINKDGQSQAVEIEITRKKIREIYAGLLGHMQQIRNKNLYTSARYIFARQVILDHYERLARRQTWPIFKYDSQSRTWVKSDQAWVRYKTGAEDPIDKYISMGLIAPGYFQKGIH